MRDDIEHLREVYRFASAASDDPDTQNGALIITRDGRHVFGANTIPAGVSLKGSRLVRPEKYLWIEHAERDAIFSAARDGRPLRGAVMYCPWYACPDCARAIIQSGIREVVGHDKPFSMTPPRWKDLIAKAKVMLFEAGVAMRVVSGDIGVAIRFDGKYTVM